MKSFLFFTLSILIFISLSQSKATPISTKAQKTILIDVSHGGKDSGAISKNGIKEKNLSLNYASYVKSELEKKKLNVILTRTDDNFLTLSDRVEIAENRNVDLMVSIHFNFSKNMETNGLETYTKPGCTKSMSLAKLLHSKISEYDLISDSGINIEKLYVLNNSPVPAILINVGYLSNEENVKLITNDEFKSEFGNIFAQTLDEYFQI